MEAHVTATTRACGRKTSARLALTCHERLAQLAGAGDERACAVPYDRYHQQLYRYCRSIFLNDADAQDALQSTMADAFGALGRGRDAPLRPWPFRIAHNESVSLLRKRRPEEKLAATSETQEASVEELVEERQRLKLLLADLGELPDRQRSALVMRELGGLSHEEIGIAIGASVSAAKQAIFEARRALAEFAKGRTMECEEIRRSISDADGRAMRGRRIRAHLRDCSGCAAFAASISERRARLPAIAPPLPATAATGVLVRILGGGSSHGGSSAGAFSGAAAGKTVGLLIATKSLAGVATVAVVAIATSDATAILSKHHYGAGSSGRVHVASAAGRPRAGGAATRPHTLSAATGGASHAVRSTEGGIRARATARAQAPPAAGAPRATPEPSTPPPSRRPAASHHRSPRGTAARPAARTPMVRRTAWRTRTAIVAPVPR
jgi:RNA polymerase sigma factor (sigma-70 family)